MDVLIFECLGGYSAGYKMLKVSCFFVFPDWFCNGFCVLVCTWGLVLFLPLVFVCRVLVIKDTRDKTKEFTSRHLETFFTQTCHLQRCLSVGGYLFFPCVVRFSSVELVASFFQVRVICFQNFSEVGRLVWTSIRS